MDAFLHSALQLAAGNALAAAALAAAVWLVVRALRSPPAAHLLWLLVLARLVVPAGIALPISRFLPWRPAAPAPLIAAHSPLREAGVSPEIEALPIADEDVSSSPEGAGSEAEPADPFASRGARALAMVWLAGAAAGLAVAAARALRFGRLLARSSRPAPAELAQLVGEVAARLGMRRPPPVFLVEAQIPPLVWSGFGRARLVLPAGLLAGMPRERLETLLAHELAHLRRGDHWLRWPELAVVCLHWWNPVAWWARRELRKAEEQCCDAWVQSSWKESVFEYARALVNTVDFLSERRAAVPRTASGLGEGQTLTRRIEMILKTRLTSRLSPFLFAGCLFAAAAALPWGLVWAVPEGEDSRGAPPAPALVGAPDGPATAANPGAAAPAQSGPGSVEARLFKLEGQLAALLTEMRALRAQSAPRATRVARVEKSLRGGGGVQSSRPEDPAAQEKEEVSEVVRESDDVEINAKDTATGKVRWKSKLGRPARGQPPMVGEKVIILTDNGEEDELDARTGRVTRRLVSPRDPNAAASGAPGGPSAPSEKASPPKPGTTDPATEGPPAADQARARKLKAEKAKLLKRLKEIEAQEAELHAEAPAPGDRIKTVSEVPGLSKIPLIGELFRHESTHQQ